MRRRGTQSNRFLQRGFTLVETVVAFALSAVLFASLMTVIAPAYRMYQRTRAQADGQMIAGNLLDTVRTAAMSVQELNAEDNQVRVGRRNAFSVRNGALYFNDDAVYDDKYYNGKHLKMETEQLGDNIILVTMEVSGGGMPDSTRASAIISPITRILGTHELGDAAQLLSDARQVLRDHAGENLSAGELFQAMYSGGEGGSEFAVFSLRNIISDARLGQLKQLADDTAKGTKAERDMINELINIRDDAERNFYLAVYYTKNTRLPITYVTDVQEAENDANNPVFFLYYDGNWYVRNPNYLPNADVLDVFDSMDNIALVNFLNAGDNFVLVSNWRIPMPRLVEIAP